MVKNIYLYEEVCGCKFQVEVQKDGSDICEAFAELKRACERHQDLLFGQVNLTPESVASIERRAHLTVQEHIDQASVLISHDLSQVRLYLSDTQATWKSPWLERTMFPLPGESTADFRQRIIERYRPMIESEQVEIVELGAVEAR